MAGANLKGADLRGADLSFADLSSADLAEANLAGAELREANLAMADLSGARLTDARLTGAQLELANLAGADLRRASLIRTKLPATIMTGAVLEMSVFGDCDLSQALGLEFVKHLGPSFIGVDTLARSGGRIPERFLRLAGVTESLIAVQGQIPLQRLRVPALSRILLVGSVQDGEFTAALEGRPAGGGGWPAGAWRWMMRPFSGKTSGSRCWGRFIYYDRLLLICSEASLGSPYGWRSFDQVARVRSSSGSSDGDRDDRRGNHRG